MQFEPKSESDLAAELVLPKGVYDFEVRNAEAKVSKKGNDMIALNLQCFSPEGASQYVNDWLVNNPHAMCLMKIRHFCRSAGLMDLYEQGTLDADSCFGAAGKVKLDVQTDDFGTKNVVVDYVEDEPQEKEPLPEMPSGQQQQAARTAAPADDEIPF